MLLSLSKRKCSQSLTTLLCIGQVHQYFSIQNIWGGTLGSQRTAHDEVGEEHIAGVLYQVGEL